MISSEFNLTAIAVVYIIDCFLFINPRDLGAIARRSQSSGRRDTVAGQHWNLLLAGDTKKLSEILARWRRAHSTEDTCDCAERSSGIGYDFLLTGKRRRVYPARDYRNSRTLSRFTEAIGVYTPSRSFLYSSPLFPFAKCPRIKWFTTYLLFCFSSEAISFRA